jgi:hypothetical protein
VAQAPPDRHLGSGAGGGPVWAVFWQELRTLGYSDQELAIEPRWAAGHEEHLPELVRLASEVIVAASAHRRWRPSMRPRRSRSSLPPPTIRSAPGSLPASRIRAAMSPGCRVCRRTLRGRSWSCSRLPFPVSSALPSWSTPATRPTPACWRPCNERPEQCAQSSYRSRSALPTRAISIVSAMMVRHGWRGDLRQTRRGRLVADLSGYGEPDTV